MSPFTLDDVRTLGTKLDGLALTSGETAVLDALLGGTTAGPEVQGFARSRSGGGYRDRMADSFSLGFKVEIEGFTQPGDVAGIAQQTSGSGI